MITSVYQALRRARERWRAQGLRALAGAVGRRFRREQLPTRIEISRLAPVALGPRTRFPSGHGADLMVIATCWGDAKHLSQWIVHTSARYNEHPFKLRGVLMKPALREQLPWSGMNIDVDVCCSSLSVAEALNASAHYSLHDTLIFTSDKMSIQPKAFAILQGTLKKFPSIAAVSARVLRPDGRQRERLVLLNRNGNFEVQAAGSDPWQPEDAFLRPVDFAQGDVFAIRRAVFNRLGGFSPRLTDPHFLIADLSLRLRVHQALTCYQPQALAVDLSTGEPLQSPLLAADAAAADHRIFRRRWIDSELWESRACLSSAWTVEPVHKSALVIDYDFPAPDRDSGSLRLVNLLRLMQELAYDITLLTMSLQPRPGYVTDLQRDGIRCLYRPYVSSLHEHLREQGYRYHVVMLCRMETADALMPAVRQYCPRATVIFDTVDLHFLRLSRQAMLTPTRRLQALADRAKKTELAMIAAADHTFVVSETERDLIVDLSPRSNVSLVSNIHSTAAACPPYSERAGILFVGGFNHPPNLDAVNYFVEQILPRLQASDPAINCLVVGADPPRQIRHLRLKQLQVLGHQPSLEPFLCGCRLSIAPLRFGAGVKGKIHESLAHGLPVVATSLAAEGMHLQDGESVLIADDPDSFVAAILRLYNSPQLWRRLSDNGISVIEEHFSVVAAMKGLRAALGD